MPRKILRRRPARKPRRLLRRKPMRPMRAIRGIATNTAAVRENYTLAVPDGTVGLFSAALSEIQYNRSQQVAECFQEFRVKYIKLTFRPSCDTFAYPGNGPIPQLYYMVNKAAAITTSTTLQTLLDMGARPKRFDDKNIVVAWKPTALTGGDQFPPASGLEASLIKTTPWISTNLYAQNPGAAWAPSNVQHYGLCFIVTRPNPTVATNYNVDVEIVFQFRKPLSTVGVGGPVGINKDGQFVMVDVSGAAVTAAAVTS